MYRLEQWSKLILGPYQALGVVNKNLQKIEVDLERPSYCHPIFEFPFNLLPSPHYLEIISSVGLLTALSYLGVLLCDLSLRASVRHLVFIPTTSAV
ncbi:uncharacterized protein BJX67DRAFT_341617 [Aspergillus lucknowensis]|uniref:Uncharacterized protein n=1 Tax=Aspergillus lucknowensis TaxID=176173 RepID=A0ABR4M6C0_9EURO